MAAEGWGEEKFIPRGRSTVKNKERGGGRGVKSRGVGGEGGEERLKKKKKKNGRSGSGNLLEKNYIIGLPFEGVNPETKIWQQVNDIRESSLTLLDFSVINNSHNQ